MSDPRPPYGFRAWPASGGWQPGRPVYVAGTGPAVIVMHEVSGMSPGCVDLGHRLVESGYTAVLPLFFGKPYQNSPTRGAVQLCVRREFTLLGLGKSSPISDWLRKLCQAAALRYGGPGVGVIGMCMSGGLALAMLALDDTVAAVAAQPSLPATLRWSSLRRRRDLGLSENDLTAVRAKSAPVLALRFKRDPLCPGERLERLREELGDRVEIHEVPCKGAYDDARPPIPRRAHAVLTEHLVDEPQHPTAAAMAHVVRFLTKHLPPTSTVPGFN